MSPIPCSAWPAIYPEFQVGISNASYITMTVAGCTIISSLLSARLINRYGTAVVTAVSISLTAVALFGFSVSPNMLVLCLFAIPSGLGAGAIDSALNSFVALHYKATHMNFMHCFYGIGVSVSPYLMSYALKGHTWQYGYRLAFILQLTLSIISIASIPLWRKIHPEPEIKTEENRENILSVSQMLKIPSVRWACLYFFAACAVELTCGNWCSTYLVEWKGLLPENAASYTMFFYVGIAVGRFLSGVLSSKLSGWALIKLGFVILIGGLLLLLLPLPAAWAIAFLFLVGVGIGPLFPNMMHLTGQNFDADIALSISGLQMTATYTGILIMPAVFGFLAQTISISLYPYYLLVMTVVTFIAMLGLSHELSLSGTNQP